MTERNYNRLDGDQKTTLGIVGLIALAISILIGCLAYTNVVETNRIAGAKNPLLMRCALRGGREADANCVIYLTKRNSDVQ